MIIAGSSFPIHIRAAPNARHVPVDAESAQNPRVGAYIVSGVPEQLVKKLLSVGASGGNLIRYKARMQGVGHARC
jgi:hypothetical protein